MQRDDDTLDGIPGTVNLIGSYPGSTDRSVIASMVLVPTGNNTGAPFVLDASNSNSTTAYLMAVPGMNSSTNMDAWIKIPVLDPINLTVDSYCATFDPDPPTPAPVSMEPCNPGSEGAHVSQRFAYTPETGVLRPVYLSNTSLPITNASAPMPARRGLPVAPGLAPQNVTMVFTPMTQNVLPANQLDTANGTSSVSSASAPMTSSMSMSTTASMTASSTVTSSTAVASSSVQGASSSGTSTVDQITLFMVSGESTSMPMSSSSSVPSGMSSMGIQSTTMSTSTAATSVSASMSGVSSGQAVAFTIAPTMMETTTTASSSPSSMTASSTATV